MKKIRIQLQQLAGEDFRVVAMTNAVKHSTHHLKGHLTVYLGARISQAEADILCADRSVEVHAQAVRD